MRPQNKHLVHAPKGSRNGGRQKGTPNKFSRDVKEAILNAAALSEHSKTHDLVGYTTYLADKKPEVFASLLGRLIPLQANVKHTNLGGDTIINVNMPLSDMINNLDRRIKAAMQPVAPLMIEHEPSDA